MILDTLGSPSLGTYPDGIPHGAAADPGIPQDLPEARVTHGDLANIRHCVRPGNLVMIATVNGMGICRTSCSRQWEASQSRAAWLHRKLFGRLTEADSCDSLLSWRGLGKQEDQTALWKLPIIQASTISCDMPISVSVVQRCVFQWWRRAGSSVVQPSSGTKDEGSVAGAAWACGTQRSPPVTGRRRGRRSPASTSGALYSNRSLRASQQGNSLGSGMIMLMCQSMC